MALSRIQRRNPGQPVGALIDALFVWRRLPMLILNVERWSRYVFDTRTGQRIPESPLRRRAAFAAAGSG